MRKLREWVLTLGVMAAAPAVGLAGPFSLPSLPFTQEKVSNQEVAEGIASSLQQARLQGTDIQIEFKGGVATLAGKVTDAGQKAKATQVVSQVAGVKTVDNRLQVQSERTPNSGGIQQATFFDGPAQPNFSPIRQVGAETPAPTAATPANSNQAVAENIAGALGTAGLNGYDIQISYQDGTATLSGAVANPQQRLMAEQAASSVSGVKLVSNQLRLPAAPQMAAAPQMGPQRGPQMAPQQSPYIPAGYQGQPGPPPGYGQPGPPAGYGQPGAMASHTVHNSPNLPPHSYPTYGAYPNSAAVSYPKQYGASAFPYIGPFYPYPQVPLGWRKSTLEWKDGSWALDFDAKTDKWWWFMSPKNW
ncbi:BON domain-containing protein [Planctomycetaceae bacterium]|jgi:osmotically-inducible protein OsmY|nr:BON domain-containing protein [bacterium]MDC0308043.1 BON domain-containing protein [Planctomycetaceae bacterium]